ncbi:MULTISPECIES: flagellin [unclassified Brevundimonas]|uniref:flagellin n=1 Tax=unclassified Brevundimonas TaxID=2622653 RepID=UPI000CFBBA11|nr:MULTISPECIES: flagellin [unclassified Brevundimonas]PRA24033.1 flagellin [Brevundimonas sp. MYb27]PQZ82882.1 flagellin [Brevundimonas sp. MYb31]PRB16722.1 flagellin [Brevundimonas sp. MYb52]PRB34741.1 flagellin [Brevundimonas sp. MYb46]PRB54691.1 flagellin [Brevundimonas sp. MYb33]
MSNSVLTNASALIALQNLNSTNNKLAATQSRVNTGLKVQGAKDNAATWAIAQNQRADTGALDAVKTSMNRATSLADVSLAAGAQISDLLIELREKATAAADPSQTAATRKAYNDEFQSLLKSLQSFADNATFDGENILNGKIGGVRPVPPATLTGLDFLANVNATETITVNRQDMSLIGLGLAPTTFTAPVTAFDLTTEANAEKALADVVAAMDTANAKLAELGAQSKQVEKHNTFVSKLMDSLEVGIGNLVDADMAKESARLQALQVQQQLGAQALSIANQAPQIILSLFKG